MKTRRILIALSILALSAVFCSTSDIGLPQDVMLTVTAQVPALQTEVAQQLTQVALSPAPPASPAGVGSISGTLNYPADTLPAIRVVAIDTSTGQVFSVDNPAGQQQYQIPNVPAGTYNVVAYTIGSESFPAGLAGGYTVAVPCGLGEGCTDHSLLPVAVETANETTNINPIDWFAPGLPTMPGLPAPTQSPPTSGTPQGRITGRLSYPSEFIPPQAVVAYRVDTFPKDYYYVLTEKDQPDYAIDVPSGEYYVIAYVQAGDYAGGYTQAVPCQLALECDHSLLPVTVTAGAVVEGIDPGDWYGAEGSFPPNPITQ